jgi:hypothetical protein
LKGSLGNRKDQGRNRKPAIAPYPSLIPLQISPRFCR